MKKSLIYGLILTAAVSGCKGDYDDWADPQGYPQEEAKNVTLTVAPAEAIDMANVTTDSLTLFTPTLESAEQLTLVTYKVELGKADSEGNVTDQAEIEADAKGQVATADLKNAVETLYGKRPDQRTLQTSVTAIVKQNAQAFRASASTVQTYVTLVAPVISSAYYIVGGSLDWSASAASKEQKFSHSSADVYDDPVFTITFKAATNDEGNPADTWFAIGSEEACDAVTNGDWTQLLGSTLGNGENGIETTEKLDTRANIGNDGSFKVAASYGAKFIKVEINMMDYTYCITPLAFQEYLYMAGDANGWAQNDFLSSPAYDGEYTGFMYLNNNGFKFCTEQSWSGTNYGEGFSTDGGAGNMSLPDGYEAGYYKVDLSLTSNTLALTAITTIGVIGDATANGWDASTPLTYNQAGRCWEGDVTFTDGTFKFRANDAWDINWGGELTNLAFGGDNISVTAGTYHVTLYPNCPGKAYATLTAK